MEFWGVEVKSGETLKVQPGKGKILRLSMASVGEVIKEKASESVRLFANFDGKKLLLATLFSRELPQQQLHLFFDQDFELFHDWKAGSVYFNGYKAPLSDGYPWHLPISFFFIFVMLIFHVVCIFLFSCSKQYFFDCLVQTDGVCEQAFGAEVKSGETLKVQPGKDKVLRLLLASIGEVKKDKASESVCLFVNFDGKKQLLGTLFTGKLPQQQFDLICDQEFDLFHNWKAGSIYFYGYTTRILGDIDEVHTGKKRAAESSTSINVQTDKKQKQFGLHSCGPHEKSFNPENDLQ